MSDPGHSPTRAFGNPTPHWPAPTTPPWAAPTTPPVAQPPAQAPPGWSPAPSTPERRGPRVLAAVLIVLSVLTAMIAPAVAGGVDDGRAASAAMAYVPASGSRVVLQGSDGLDQVDEYYTTVGLSVTQSGPTAVGYAAEGGLAEFSSTTWVRVTSLLANAQAEIRERSTQVYAAQASGLELRVAAWPDRFLFFRPGFLVLPAHVTDGQSWTVAGTATVGSGAEPSGELPFAAEFRAAAGEPGCVRVDSTLTVGSGGDATTATSSTTWCLGQGMTGGSDDSRTLTAVSRAPVWQRLGRAAQDPVTTTGLTGQPTRQDLTGRPPMAITPRVAPVVLPGPVVVYANNIGADLVARGWSDGVTDARWAAHPGGSITALLAIGRVVIAATTERALVAYGAQGEFLWQASLSDASEVPLTSLVQLGTLVVVASLDGRVRAFDAETGALAWEQRLPNEVRLPMQVGAAGVTVLDQAGNLRTFGADGAVLHELEADPPESYGIVGDLVVVASRMDAIVRGYRISDGSLAWRTPVAGARNAIDAVGDVAVIRQSDNLLALRATDGGIAWSTPMRATTSAVRGATLLVADRTTLHQLDATGRSLGSWPTQEADLDNSSALGIIQTSTDVFLLYGSVAYRWERQ